MKALTLLVLSFLIGSCSAYLIKIPTVPIKPSVAPLGWVHVQKLMLPLFENVCEDSTNEVVVRLAQEFTLDASKDAYTKTDVLENLRQIRINKGCLPKNAIFSEFTVDHMSELKAVFELLYYAKDFNTFYKAACWARQNINCGLFVDALYLTVISRRDTANISLPAPFELLPNYFIQKDVIIKASSLLNGFELSEVDNVKVGNNAYILDANYTADDNEDEDSKLAYFREDIGLNTYYYLRKLRYVFNPSMSYNEGEQIYMMMKQLAARYDLERYSNGQPELESIKWDSEVTSYNPMLIYSNGFEFSYRTFSSIISDSDDVEFLKTIEYNVAAVATHLRQAGHDKTQILNHLMQLLTTAHKNYEVVARRLLGYATESNERQYSTLEHYITTLRDPAYWKINKKIVELIDDCLKVLPRYTRKELYFPGVEVMSVETKKIITSFDTFQFDVTDSLTPNTANTTYQVKIAQMRLNHQPLTVKLNISSLAFQKGVVKIFLGPKTMPGELLAKRNLFLLIDNFEHNFKRGINIVSRSSEEMEGFSKDFISLRDIRKNIEDVEFGLDVQYPKEVEEQIGYPSRLILPKGSLLGLPLQLFVFVAPYYISAGNSISPIKREFNSAISSPGYPLDLLIDEKTIFNLPNTLIKDITITHKDESKSNNYNAKTGSNKYNSRPLYPNLEDTNFEPAQDNVEGVEYFNYTNQNSHNLLNDRPAFTYKNNTTDYTAKRNQYNNRKNFTRQNEYKSEDYSSPNARNEYITSVNITPENTTQDNKFDIEKNNDSVVEVAHGLLKSRAVPYKFKEKYQYTKKQEDVYNPLKYNKYELYEKSKLMTTTTIKSEVFTLSSVDNVHKLLGSKPYVSYDKKDNLDYTVKRNQSKKKKEEYELKRAQYMNNESRIDNKSTYYPDKINATEFNANNKHTVEGAPIVINKNIYDGKISKNMSSYDTVAEKTDKLIKNKKQDSTTQRNSDVTIYAISSDEILDKSMSSVEVGGEDIEYVVLEPILVPEVPKRKATVYDFLFNFDKDENRVYE